MPRPPLRQMLLHVDVEAKSQCGIPGSSEFYTGDVIVWGQPAFRPLLFPVLTPSHTTSGLARTRANVPGPGQPSGRRVYTLVVPSALRGKAQGRGLPGPPSGLGAMRVGNSRKRVSSPLH